MNKEDKIFNSMGFAAEFAIKEAKNCLDTEIKEYNHHEQMCKLARKNLTDVICQEVHYIWTDYIVPAQRYLCSNSEPDKDSEMAFTQLVNVLSTAFDHTVKIFEIHSEGLREHGWRITFTLGDFVFALYVPNLDVDKNFEHDGQLAIYLFIAEDELAGPVCDYDILKIGQAINTTIKDNPKHWSYSDYTKYKYDDNEYEDNDNEG